MYSNTVRRFASLMLIEVDRHNGIPAYRQIIDQVKFHVASGLAEAGEELPSTRALSSRLGLNPMTISKAYSFLERDGVVERRPGRSVVIRSRQPRSAGTDPIEQLRRSLLPTLTVVRQLSIDPETAVDLFRRMLASKKRG
jgi:GntR family transcriptional regulator